jgi:hypothetical protein
MAKNDKEYYHDKGEQDASDGKYDRPHGVLDEFSTWTKSGMDKHQEDNDSYDRGYSHGKGQRDANEGRYRPPSDSDDREAYDAGYDSAKEDSKKGGCFISTACAHARNLPDDCEELQTLRTYRDTYLCARPGGDSLVAIYYAVAPAIVESIDARPDSREIYQGIYEEIIHPAVDLVGRQRFEAALVLYKAGVEALIRKYCPPD